MYEAATGKSIQGMNYNKTRFKIAYKNIHKAKLPIQLKQMILHMIAFKAENRINSFSLSNCFKEILIHIQRSF